VNKVLGEIGVTDIPVITVFNKIDLIGNHQFLQSLLLRYTGAIAVSSVRAAGLDTLCEALKKAAMAGQITLTLDFGSEDHALLREIYRLAAIRNTEEKGDKIRLTFTIPSSIARKLNLNEIILTRPEKS
jgi:GTPase